MVLTDRLQRGARGTLATACALIALLPADLLAARSFQNPGSTLPAGEAGWVGLQVDFVATSARRARDGDHIVVVSGVVPESPAAVAGVQRGDTLLFIDGRAASPRSFEELRQGLRAGDSIELEVRRDSGLRAFDVVAAARPRFTFDYAPAFELRIDSLRTVILTSADSLRRRALRQAEALNRGPASLEADSFVTVVDLGSGKRMRIAGLGGTLSVWTDEKGSARSVTGSWSVHFEEPGLPQSFETLVVQTPRTDSLRASIVRLRQELDRVRRNEARLARKLNDDPARAHPTNRAALEPKQAAIRDELREVQAVREALTARIAERQHELRALSRAELESGRSVTAPPEPATPPRSVAVQRGTDPTPRPITPHLVGRSYLAGARMAPLNRGLAEYFSATDGVLVTDVVDATPAQEAGLLPGDVVVAVDDRPVRDLDQLRARLSGHWHDATISVIRMDDTLRIRVAR